ncbi:hypothetical protein MFRU_015g01370 [Monilinia fructicola]|nr:hypothetical protein MFRU_015g01370 [Monilinia fructicola]
MAPETLDRGELHRIVINLIDNDFLSMEEIQEGLILVQEKRYTEEGIAAAISALPTYKFREFVSELMQSNSHYQKWLVHEWRLRSSDIEDNYDGDPYEGDPFALVAFMDEQMPPRLRAIIMDMARESTPIRDWLKNELLIIHEDGILELRYFDENPPTET